MSDDENPIDSIGYEYAYASQIAYIYEDEGYDKAEEELQKELDGIDDQRSYIADLNSEKAEINADLKVAKKEIKFLESHDTCPTCTQEIDKDFKFDKVTNLQNDGVKLTKTLKKIKLDIEDLMQDVKHADDLSMQCHAVRTDIHNGDRDIVRLSMENLEINKELAITIEKLSYCV